jgi:hypothetical protein
MAWSSGSSAQNLHENTQILSKADKHAANQPGMVGPWRKSSCFQFGDRGCHDGY